MQLDNNHKIENGLIRFKYLSDARVNRRREEIVNVIRKIIGRQKSQEIACSGWRL